MHAKSDVTVHFCLHADFSLVSTTQMIIIIHLYYSWNLYYWKCTMQVKSGVTVHFHWSWTFPFCIICKTIHNHKFILHPKLLLVWMHYAGKIWCNCALYWTWIFPFCFIYKTDHNHTLVIYVTLLLVWMHNAGKILCNCALSLSINISLLHHLQNYS